MRISSGFRTAAIALAALVATSVAAFADSGQIHIRIVKAGFVIGGSGGSGTLTFNGRKYPLSVGGISYGFTFGASETNFYGRVTNIRRPSDVAGVYGQAGAGAALILTESAGACTDVASTGAAGAGSQTRTPISASMAR